MTKQKNRRHIIVFDITKDKMEHFQYSTIEQIKNGYIMSGKYDSTSLRFNKPHIIVFANTPPDKSRMTIKDRWNIVKIQTPEYDQTIQHNTLELSDSLRQQMYYELEHTNEDKPT